MANAFKSGGSNTIGLSKTTIYTAPALTTSTVIGLSLANVLTTETTIKVDVILGKGANEYYIIRGAPVMAGGTLIVVGGDQKLVLETGNTVKVVSSIAASVDAIISVLEVS